MKLATLEPHLLQADLSMGKAYRYVNDLKDADGVMFLCPVCFAANGGKAGTHSVICWFRGRVPEEWTPNGRWNPAGTGVTDLSFVGPGACSVLLHAPCNAHFHVKDGEIVS